MKRGKMLLPHLEDLYWAYLSRVSYTHKKQILEPIVNEGIVAMNNRVTSLVVFDPNPNKYGERDIKIQRTNRKRFHNACTNTPLDLTAFFTA